MKQTFAKRFIGKKKDGGVVDLTDAMKSKGYSYALAVHDCDNTTYYYGLFEEEKNIPDKSFSVVLNELFQDGEGNPRWRIL